MAYLTYELSSSDGFATELYKIYSDGFDTPYYYTSADEDITYNSQLYKANLVKRSQPELSRESNSEAITINLPRTDPLVLRWLSFVPPRTVWVTIYRYHRSETGAPEVVIFWQGKIRGITWSINEASLQCAPIDTAFSRNGLRKTYSTTCQHFLYDPRTCGVPIGDFSKNCVVTAINHNVITSPGFTTTSDNTTVAPLGWWTNGFMQNTTTGELRFCVNHLSGGVDVEVLVAFESLNVGDTVFIAAGCDRKFQTCKLKFNNIVSNGSFPFLSSENPFLIKLT